MPTRHAGLSSGDLPSKTENEEGKANLRLSTSWDSRKSAGRTGQLERFQGEAQDDPQRMQPADLQASGYSQQMQDCLSSGNDKGVRHEIPPGITAVGAFLFFGTIMASLAGATLSWPGTSFDKIWALNPTAHKHLASLGKPIGILFLFLGAALALAGTGWFKRRLWGWRLAVALIATQVLGDLVNFLRGDWLRGGVGFSIATALLVYLLRPAVRAVFNRAILA